jgi:hypothetical protein
MAWISPGVFTMGSPAADLVITPTKRRKPK